ncbi:MULTISPECIES: O-methyltransferase [Sporosarcina]|uniref:Methyltransferase n=1 Tax=Sporosarcina ureae TaxID=1571 RepID=A0ABM6JSG8_SPOUR|nr:MULTISPECIES: O-methyltransferase [Sporosarcina]ARF12927.1 methyltransferase [Sporosarcina ureae]PIC77552.1 O-methyltransferase [Sporosarcina sp. P19]
MKVINQYIDQTFVSTDQVLEDVLLSIQENGMRSISVSPASGKTLTMLVSLTGAKNVLEIGALGGYSGICLARGFNEEGHLTSLELEESFATLAKSNLTKAGFGEQVTYKTGLAVDSLKALKAEGKTFDFFFIDADKENYQNYLDGCLELAEPNAVIVADNVLAGGSVANPSFLDKQYTENMRKFNEYTAQHPRLTSVLLPIGDGLTISQVQPVRS